VTGMLILNMCDPREAVVMRKKNRTLRSGCREWVENDERSAIAAGLPSVTRPFLFLHHLLLVSFLKAIHSFLPPHEGARS